MEQSIIEIDDHDIFVFQIDLDKVPFLILKANKGYVMSEHLDIKIANGLGEVAGKIKDAKTINTALNTKIYQVSKKALEKGLRPGISVRNFLKELF
jgi:uncharacterized protein YunC (DUF1805 family)